MKPSTLLKPSTLVIAALLALGAATAASAQTEYLVTVNTSPISNGAIDFQFNPSGVYAAGTVTITNFTFDFGTLGPPPVLTGDASGSLPSPVTLDNGTGFNDYFENFNFGNTLSFDATFTGAALTPPPGTTGSSVFALSLYDANGNPQQTTNPDGSIADITVNPDGTFTTQTFPSPGGFGNLATITLVSNPVPEASTTVSLSLLLALGLGGVLIAARRKKAMVPATFTA